MISIFFKSILSMIFEDNKHFFIDSLAAKRPAKCIAGLLLKSQ